MTAKRRPIKYHRLYADLTSPSSTKNGGLAVKRTLLLAYSALLFVYLLPLVFRDRPAQPPRETETAPLLPAGERQGSSYL